MSDDGWRKNNGANCGSFDLSSVCNEGEKGGREEERKGGVTV